mgnify:CR=1 FL=1
MKICALCKKQAGGFGFIKPLGEYVSEIGMNRPLSDYTREEVLCLIEVAVTSYQEYMQGKVDDSDILPGGNIHA